MSRCAGASPLPPPSLSLWQAVAIIVGIVLGAGIFKSPALVAQFSATPGAMLWAWVLGGAISLLGALCYAELAATWPHAGGDYHFLFRAYGRRVAFLFAWARFSVITTGSIALLAFVFGDYMHTLVPLGPYGPALWGALSLVALTWLNGRGLQASATTQSWLTLVEVVGLVLIIAAGLWLGVQGPGAEVLPPAVQADAPATVPRTLWGLVMVFVLLTYGGWNEAAYLSAEMRGARHRILHALLISLVCITLLYVAVNLAYLQGLGLPAMAGDHAVAASLLDRAFGPAGQVLIAVMVAVTALTSMNATMLVGARTNFAVGRDWPRLGLLGQWHAARGVPLAALYAQSACALGLIVLGGSLRSGFQAMVDFTAPVFWLFFLLSTLALIVLRVREPEVERPFRVPFYPWLPLLFAGVCGYMLWSSLAYVQAGAWLGVGVLALGGLLMRWLQRGESTCPSTPAGCAPCPAPESRL
jgi:APA family basic amino acid/polyamine antiporter